MARGGATLASWSPAATSARADQLATQMNCKAVDWDARHSVNPDVLVNCTPVRDAHPFVDETPFEKHHLRPSMLVYVRHGFLQPGKHAADQGRP